MSADRLLLTTIALIQLLLLPALLVTWQALERVGSVGGWLLQSVTIGALLLVMDRLFDWSFLGVWVRHFVRLLFVAALVYSGLRLRGRPLLAWPEGRDWLPVTVSILLLVAAGLLLATYLRGQRVPEEPVRLTFPLQDGCFHVAHGGSEKLVNGHVKVSAPGLHQWRGQMWGLDIVALNKAGARARNLFPRDLTDYAIFGEPVYAPCAGEVVAAENTLPDLIPPDSDGTNKAGNYVMIRCSRDAVILLAHLKQGSVVVQPGRQVTRGDRLGEVGNSGNTSEPHLHVSAQRGLGSDTILDADPRPMTFDGTWLVRNDTVCKEG